MASDLAAGAAGDLYISDSRSSLIWHVGPSGQAGVLAGNGSFASSADGTRAAGNPVSAPAAVALDAAGNLYFTESAGTGGKVRAVHGGVLYTEWSSANAVDGLAVSPAVAQGPAGLAVSAVGAHEIELLGNCSTPYVAAPVPPCLLSQLVSSELRTGGKSTPPPSYVYGPWTPIAAPNPARVNGPILVAFPAPVAHATLTLFGLDGRALSTYSASGAQAHLSAPASPGLYFLGVQALGQDGGNYTAIRKIAVLP